MDEELAVLEQQERLLRELGKTAELAQVLALQSDKLAKRGDTDAAVSKLEEAETLFRNLNEVRFTEKAIFHQVMLLQDTPGPKLLSVLQRQEAFYKSTGEEEDLAECLDTQARAFTRMGAFDKEFEKWDEQIPLWTRLGNKERLSFCYGVAAACLCRLQKDPEKAVRYVAESIRLSRELGKKEQIARAEQTLAVLHSQARTQIPERAWDAAARAVGRRNAAELDEWAASRLHRMIAEMQAGQQQNARNGGQSRRPVAVWIMVVLLVLAAVVGAIVAANFRGA
jgi:tetratricopeptide (TPR) repeat protein